MISLNVKDDDSVVTGLDAAPVVDDYIEHIFFGVLRDAVRKELDVAWNSDAMKFTYNVF